MCGLHQNNQHIDMASEIPIDLVENIRKRLNTIDEVARFRAVCKSWRSLIPPSEKRLIRAQLFRDNYIINETVVYCLAPLADDPCGKRSWLIKVAEGESGKTRLLHPLSQTTVRISPTVINLFEYRVSELAKFHTLCIEDGERFKVAMDLDSDSPAIMITIGQELYYGKVGLDNKVCLEKPKFNPDYCPNSGTRFDSLNFEDVIYYEGKFYAVCSAQDGEVVVIDSCMNARMVKFDMVWEWHHRRNLVVSYGELLLVVAYIRYTSRHPPACRFKVFKLDAAKEQWVEVENEALDDRIFIVGKDRCFCVSTRDFPGCKGNTFYFTARSYHLAPNCGVVNYDLAASFSGIHVFRGSHLTRNYHTNDNIFGPSPSSGFKKKRQIDNLDLDRR